MPPTAALLTNPLFDPSAGGAVVGVPGGGAAFGPAGVGDRVSGLLGAGAGDGGLVGGDTVGSGVGAAVGETLGAPDGACAVQEIASRERRRRICM